MRKVSSVLLWLLTALLVLNCSTFQAKSKTKPKRQNPPQVQSPGNTARLKLVWLSLDGLNSEALLPLVNKMPSHAPRGLRWVLQQAHGKSDLKVIAPTITAPSHISVITCTGPGEHGILDNTSWTGTNTTSGFGRVFSQETWPARLRKQGLRVGSALFPTIDAQTPERTVDVGIYYDNPGSSTQILKVSKASQLSGKIPSRVPEADPIKFDLLSSPEGQITVKTPFGEVGPLEVAKPVDIMLESKLNAKQRRAAITFMLISSTPTESSVAVSPIQIMPTMGDEFTRKLDDAGIFFSSLKDYKYQNEVSAYLASLAHKRTRVANAQIAMLGSDIDVAFMYFEDIDSVLHAYFKDASAETEVIKYLTAFDKDLSRVLSSVPSTADLVIHGDHGMSAIGYVLNARKILSEEVAAKGYVWTGGGAMYLYPPVGDMTQDPPQGMDIEQIAQDLRKAKFEVTGQDIFGKVIVRGSPEAKAEGLTGKNVPWIMAFANDGIAFKNSTEDKYLLARAAWAQIPAAWASKYPDPMNSGKLQVPVPAGQHGHWNELSQMRTRLVFEGPHLSKVSAGSISKSLDLVPVVADQLKWPRPSGCLKK